MDKINYRKERIDRLLHELRYEIERGLFENEIDPKLRFRFYAPVCPGKPGAIVLCEFRTQPVMPPLEPCNDFYDGIWP